MAKKTKMTEKELETWEKNFKISSEEINNKYNTYINIPPGPAADKFKVLMDDILDSCLDHYFTLQTHLTKSTYDGMDLFKKWYIIYNFEEYDTLAEIDGQQTGPRDSTKTFSKRVYNEFKKFLEERYVYDIQKILPPFEAIYYWIGKYEKSNREIFTHIMEKFNKQISSEI